MALAELIREISHKIVGEKRDLRPSRLRAWRRKFLGIVENPDKNKTEEEKGKKQ
jgi:hypothetical protein